MLRSVKGYAYATLSLIALAAMIGAIFAVLSSDNPVSGMLLGAAMGVVIAPLPVLVIGVPAHLVLQRISRASLRAYLWAGFGVAALLAAAIGMALPHGGARMVVALIEIAAVLLGGPCAAAGFWYGARPDRPAACALAALP